MHPKLRNGEIDQSKNLGVLLVEFFEVYGRYFNYERTGICLRDGGSYYNKYDRGWNDYRTPGLLSVEDPQDSGMFPATLFSRLEPNSDIQRTT
jgi:non-canonical poly(A) RNA polymerase PAPD5/7